MLKLCRPMLFGFGLLAAAATSSWATPSSIIFIPSTDVQAPNTNHLGLDSYFSYNNPRSGTVTDFGYTRGFNGRFELGLDFIGAQSDPWLVNAKWQALPQKGKVPAVAIGGYNWGGHKNVLAGNLFYVLASETFEKLGRFSIGYQHGQNNRIGGEDPDMLLLAFEKQLTKRWWAAVDFASGDSTFGAVTPGVAYTFSPNTSVILGYDFYNNSAFVDTITVQVDINF
jgi:hypothetical protein